MAGVTDIIKNGYSSLTGSIEKAHVKIKETTDWRAGEWKLQEGTKPGGNVSGGFDVGGAMSGLDAINEAAGELGMDLEEMALDATGLGDVVDAIANLTDDYSKVFTVQFNPSSLQLRGSGGGETSQIMQDFTGGDGYITTRMKLSMVLSVTLLFDCMEQGSSFPLSADTVALSDAMNTALKATKSLMGFGNTVPPVQFIMEGFIGAIRNPATRQVCFEWGDMRYEGVLKGVDGTYTMFDAVGHPVRGEVNLSIYLRDPFVRNSGGKVNLGYWQKAYQKAFSSSASYVSGAQQFLRTFGGA